MDKFLNLANDRQEDFYTEEDCKAPISDYKAGLEQYNQCGCKKTEYKMGSLSYNNNSNCRNILNKSKSLLKQTVKSNNEDINADIYGGKIKMCKHHMPRNKCKICKTTCKHHMSRNNCKICKTTRRHKKSRKSRKSRRYR
jgi:hypothetical protein